MNMNLQDLQHDIQRLASQQAQQMQAQQLLQAQQIANMLNQVNTNTRLKINITVNTLMSNFMFSYINTFKHTKICFSPALNTL